MGELVTASEWKRSAIVWAFTHDGRKTTSSLSVGINEFCGFEVSGLRSKDTVRKYRKAWKLAIDNGFATDVKPGDLIDLPITTW